MTVTVTRIFDSEHSAREAEAALKQYAMPGQVTVVTPMDNADAEAKLAETGMSRASAVAYAEAVARGRWVVSVAPTFGFAARVTAALDASEPVDTHVVDIPDADTSMWRAAAADDAAAPLSSKLGWPVLLDEAAPVSKKFGWRVLLNDPAPLSRLLGWRLLSPDQKPRARLIDDAAPLSARFGWRLLSSNPAPLSERLGWRVHKDGAAPASARFGWRLLSPNAAPRASLIHNPAPLSSWLGLKLLMTRSSTDTEK